jgi:peptide/nickel transport system substrate-binding protein/oligopeptide transport system substrate-binding protein
MNPFTLTRRQLLRYIGMSSAAALAAACVPPATAAAAPAEAASEAPATQGAVNAVGKKLPADAAPSEQQVLVLTPDSQAQNPNTRFMDLLASVYSRAIGGDLFTFPLIRLDKDFNVVPGLAKSWKPNADATAWTFSLREDLNWSDGSPVTADDVVASFRHIAKKETAYDFSWYIEEMNIKGYSDAIAGKGKPEDIGVKQGANAKEVVFELTKAIPYLPMMMLYSGPMQKKALDKSGPTYNSDVKTSVSSGPYVLSEWSPTRVVVEANKNMPDDLKPFLNKVIFINPKNALQAYQANEVERARAGSGADVRIITTNPTLKAQSTQDPNDFRIHYFFFDQSKAPFNNLKVRQAFARLFDRETIMKKILPEPAAKPAWSFLAPGVPGSNVEALKQYQQYNPEMAKKLYAESGVKITQELTLQVRTDNPIEDALLAMAQVYADELKKQLGITVKVQRQPAKVFMDSLNAKPTKLDFGFVSYGIDYLDQSNMLSVFRNNGRHNWNNDKYQKILDEAGPMADKAKRDALYKEAEKILVDEVGGIFALQQFDVWVWKPYISGISFKPGKVNKSNAVGWPGFSGLSLGAIDTYVTKDVAKFRPNPPK